MIQAHDVLEMVAALESADVNVWLDGGWGVDALLGEQTREHDDLDVVLALDAVAAARETLAGLDLMATEDELPTRLVLADARDRRIDLHPVTFDGEGGGTQRLQDGSAFRYPPDGFRGRGYVSGRMVHCLSPETQLLCHIGYLPDADDMRDVLALCCRFALPLPALYHERGVLLE